VGLLASFVYPTNAPIHHSQPKHKTFYVVWPFIKDVLVQSASLWKGKNAHCWKQWNHVQCVSSPSNGLVAEYSVFFFCFFLGIHVNGNRCDNGVLCTRIMPRKQGKTSQLCSVNVFSVILVFMDF